MNWRKTILHWLDPGKATREAFFGRWTEKPQLAGKFHARGLMEELRKIPPGGIMVISAEGDSFAVLAEDDLTHILEKANMKRNDVP